MRSNEGSVSFRAVCSMPTRAGCRAPGSMSSEYPFRVCVVERGCWRTYFGGLWGVFIIAVHRAFVLGLGAQHRGIVKLSENG